MSQDQSGTTRGLRAARGDTPGIAADKDLFVAMIAHELRQPLAALAMQADVLRRLGTQRQDEPLLEMGEEVHATVHRQTRLVNDLLDLSRVRLGRLALDMAPVALGPLVTRVATSMTRAAPSVELRLDVAPVVETLACHADGVRLEQIFSNLMDNALKSVGADGVIEVRLVAEGGFARIAVADTGRGMAPGAVDNLFQLFGQEHGHFTAHGAGLGIGLALVHELVRAHGGRVDAHSEGIGKGATFTVWLPLSANDGRVALHDGRAPRHAASGDPSCTYKPANRRSA